VTCPWDRLDGRRSVCESRAYADIITPAGNLRGNQGMALKFSENLRRNDIASA
jgi:hypothetical protein